MPNEVVCFHCGQPVGDPPRLNELEQGETCAACAERLLDSLPGIFHTPYETVAEAVEAAEEGAGASSREEPGEGWHGGGGDDHDAYEGA